MQVTFDGSHLAITRDGVTHTLSARIYDAENKLMIFNVPYALREIYGKDPILTQLVGTIYQQLGGVRAGPRTEWRRPQVNKPVATPTTNEKSEAKVPAPVARRK